MEASFGSSICTKNSPLSILGKNSPPTNPAPTRESEPKNNTTATKSVMILFLLLFKDHSKSPEIQWVNASILLSNQRIIFQKIVLPETFFNFPNREESLGTNVKEDKNENAEAIITVTANCLIILATKSPLSVIGRKTTIITKVMATTVNPISEASSYAARTLFFPISMWRWMFSKTTIASSTKIPTTNESAVKLIKLSVKPIK